MRSGETYVKDDDPGKTAEIEYQSNFEKLEITDTNINWSIVVEVGDLTVKITNNGTNTMDRIY